MPPASPRKASLPTPTPLVTTDMIRDNPNVRPDLIPVGRFGAVDEVAEVAVMLARNGYVTGQALNVDGSRYMS